jgi:hypothetical protein
MERVVSFRISSRAKDAWTSWENRGVTKAHPELSRSRQARRGKPQGLGRSVFISPS